MSQDKPVEGQPTEAIMLMRDVARAMDNLPILARLEFAANLVFDAGGIKDTNITVPELVIAHDVIKDVIKILEANPTAAQLRTPTPVTIKPQP
jgi:hypothetical protein